MIPASDRAAAARPLALPRAQALWAGFAKVSRSAWALDQDRLVVAEQVPDGDRFMLDRHGRLLRVLHDAAATDGIWKSRRASVAEYDRLLTALAAGQVLLRAQRRSDDLMRATPGPRSRVAACPPAPPLEARHSRCR